ncbi:MAG: hypothetical protein CMJ52_06050 [Planctomycetaceae bacterium]|nr:hypothetical protein [Planctomycetaceae bacterium]
MSSQHDVPADRRLPDELVESLVEIRHDLHAHPEVGYEEHRTSEVIQRELTAAGVRHVGGLAGGTGVLAWIPGRGEGPATGLRADIDALPIQEETGLPWASTHPGRMHACGHDGHTTILLGAARVLAEESKAGRLERPVVLVFQPAEEGGGGGRRMVEDGCLEGRVAPFKVDRMFGLHGWPMLDAGMVGVKDGPLLAASDRFEIDVHGEGCHAAQPHFGRDPVVATAAMVTALQSIVGRNVDPLDAAVVSVTVIDAGSAFNVIPMSARLGGTARSLRAGIQDLVERRIEEVATAIATAHGCRAEVRYQRGYPVTVNDPDTTDRVRAIAGEELGADRIVEVDRPTMGGEDFAFYGQVVPASFFLLGQRPSPADPMPDLHSPRYDFNDATIETGVRLFRRIALAS